MTSNVLQDKMIAPRAKDQAGPHRSLRKHHAIYCLTLTAGLCSVLRADEPAAAADLNAPHLTGPLFSLVFTPPQPRATLPTAPDAQVIARVREHHGDHDMILEHVTPPDVPAANPTDPADSTSESVAADFATKKAQWLEYRRTHPEVRINLSARIYDHRTTLLTWKNHDVGYQAWSNIDFSLLSGLTNFRAGDTTYHVSLAIEQVSTAPRHLPDGRTVTKPAPSVPEIPADPGYVITAGDASSPDAVEGIRKIHQLYQNEKTAFLTAYQRRKQYMADASAWTQAHPEQAQDVTVRFWKEDFQSSDPAEAAP